MAIIKVRRNKSNGQLIATIPRKEFEEGDYIQISKMSLDTNNTNKEKK